MRKPVAIYQDPLEIIWVESARRMGVCVQRDSEVFASWDGRETLTIGTYETLDPDDSMAQLIFHELCHSLVEGERALTLVDWGLESDNPAHRVREHACLRLQAALADRYGLRDFLAATTTFRTYYNGLPAEPLEDDGDAAVPIAREGWLRATRGPWAEPIDRALKLTKEISHMVAPFAPTESLWAIT